MSLGVITLLKSSMKHGLKFGEQHHNTIIVNVVIAALNNRQGKKGE